MPGASPCSETPEMPPLFAPRSPHPRKALDPRPPPCSECMPPKPPSEAPFSFPVVPLTPHSPKFPSASLARSLHYRRQVDRGGRTPVRDQDLSPSFRRLVLGRPTRTRDRVATRRTQALKTRPPRPIRVDPPHEAQLAHRPVAHKSRLTESAGLREGLVIPAEEDVFA